MNKAKISKLLDSFVFFSETFIERNLISIKDYGDETGEKYSLTFDFKEPNYPFLDRIEVRYFLPDSVSVDFISKKTVTHAVQVQFLQHICNELGTDSHGFQFSEDLLEIENTYYFYWTYDSSFNLQNEDYEENHFSIFYYYYKKSSTVEITFLSVEMLRSEFVAKIKSIISKNAELR